MRFEWLICAIPTGLLSMGPANVSGEQELRCHSSSTCFEKGLDFERGRGVTKDDVEAAKWMRWAAEFGNTAAMEDLGRMFLSGRGVGKKDPAAAVGWFRKAAELGDAQGQTDLAALYRLGKGVPRDDVVAASWAKKAAAGV